MEIDIKTETNGSATIITLDTEYTLKSCTLTKKLEAKIITESGVTEITNPLVNGVYVALIYKHTRFAYRIVFLPSDKMEIIEIK